MPTRKKSKAKPKSIPEAQPVVLSKSALLRDLSKIDVDKEACERILAMDTKFNMWIDEYLKRKKKPTSFAGMKTSPFVLLAYAHGHGFSVVQETEADLRIAKEYSNLETSLGRMVETVALPIYGWKQVKSKMNTQYSVVDGERRANGRVQFATLKSGYRCINDDQVKGISSGVADNWERWAADKKIRRIVFTVGLLYGTPKKSNKKDWHILERACKVLSSKGSIVVVPPKNRWDCKVTKGQKTLEMRVRIGVDLWKELGGSDSTYLEVIVALIRACDKPSANGSDPALFHLSDLKSICSTDKVPENYNVGILQRSQLEWLFMTVSHFCDELVD